MMSGMLVPVEELYEPVDKAAQAIETLFGVDPDFVLLCKSLYGPDVDPVEVWTDVFGKGNPTGSDSHVPGNLQVDRRFNNQRNRKRALEAAGIGATVIGGALGAKEVKHSVRELRAARKTGAGTLWPKAKIAGVGAMLGGDAIATGMQVSAARRNKREGVAGLKAARDDLEDVEKLSVGALANGIEHGMRRMSTGLTSGGARMGGKVGALAPKVKPIGAKVSNFGNDLKTGAQHGRSGGAPLPKDTPMHMRASQGLARAGSDVGPRMKQTFLGSNKRKMATIGGTGALAYGGMNKRDEDEDIDVVWSGEFSKFDEDKRLVFGWASVVEVNGVPVVDKQGDYIHPDDLENASYQYVIKSRVGGDMHARDGEIPLKVSDLVESMVFTPEKIAKMGLPEQVKERIPTGWWVGFKVHSDKHWDMVKKRARTGFSIHGRGKRLPTSMDELMPGYH
jgi:hypothetical protein